MPQAWEVREAQRQRLLESLRMAAFREDEDLEGNHLNRFFLELVAEIISCLKTRLTKQPDRPATEGRRVKDFVELAFSEISSFARTEEERDFLSAELALALFRSGLSPFFAALTRQEVHRPELVYGGHKATDEIPFT